MYLILIQLVLKLGSRSRCVTRHLLRKCLPDTLYITAYFVVTSLLLCVAAKFKKEDIARTLLYIMCQNLVTVAFDACVMTRTRHIFIHGNFVQHPLTQRMVWEEFEFRKWQAMTFALPGVVSVEEFFENSHSLYLCFFQEGSKHEFPITFCLPVQ